LIEFALVESAPGAIRARVTFAVSGDLDARATREVLFENEAIFAFAAALEAGEEASLESIPAGELRVAVGRDGVARASMHAGACAFHVREKLDDPRAFGATVRRLCPTH
jgi:hypothetical protein